MSGVRKVWMVAWRVDGMKVETFVPNCMWWYSTVPGSGIIGTSAASLKGLSDHANGLSDHAKNSR
jgi:hypothetical protein